MQFGQEIWSHYERGTLHDGIELDGRIAANTRIADVAAVMREISDVHAEHEARLAYKAELSGGQINPR
jgi:hypothetical protein